MSTRTNNTGNQPAKDGESSPANGGNQPLSPPHTPPSQAPVQSGPLRAPLSSNPVKKALSDMKFYRVQLHSGAAHEPPQVEISYDGNPTLVLQRGQDVILSEAHLVILRNADYQPYKTVQQFGQSMKVPDGGRRPTAPHTILGDSTYADYLVFLRNGNKLRDADFDAMKRAAAMQSG